MAKAEPDLTEVNRLIMDEPGQGSASKTVDVEYALAVLRSEHDRLKDCAKTNEERHAQNQEINRKNYEGWRQENLRLQSELLASQEKVFELQRSTCGVVGRHRRERPCAYRAYRVRAVRCLRWIRTAVLGGFGLGVERSQAHRQLMRTAHRRIPRCLTMKRQSAAVDGLRIPAGGAIVKNVV
jgi:hypothetical protein